MTSVARALGAIALPLLLLSAQLPAAEADTEAWEKFYLQCTTGCGNDYPFTQNTVKEFAPIRSACIAGCGAITPDVLPGYQRCYQECKKTFKYRHGMREEFANFQRACVEGCRNVKP